MPDITLCTDSQACPVALSCLRNPDMYRERSLVQAWAHGEPENADKCSLFKRKQPQIEAEPY